MDSTSSIYYAWNLTVMDLSSFWKMENAFSSEEHTKSMNIIYFLSLLFIPEFFFFYSTYFIWDNLVFYDALENLRVFLSFSIKEVFEN